MNTGVVEWNPLMKLPAENRRFIEGCMARGLCGLRRDAGRTLSPTQKHYALVKSERKRPDVLKRSIAKVAEDSARLMPVLEGLDGLVAEEFGLPAGWMNRKRFAYMFRDPWWAFVLLALEWTGVSQGALGRVLGRTCWCIHVAHHRALAEVAENKKFAAAVERLRSKAAGEVRTL